RIPFGLAAGLALAGLAAGLASCQETEEDTSQVGTGSPAASANAAPAGTFTPPASPTPVARTPGAGETLWRWANVTLIVRGDSGIVVSRYVAPAQRLPPNGGPEMDLILDDSQVGIDASSGRILYEAVAANHKEVFDATLATVSVDSADPASLPWPHTEETGIALERHTWGLISYIEPPPDAGIVVMTGIGDCLGQPDCEAVDSRFIEILTANSLVTVTVKNGMLSSDTSAVVGTEKALFDRYLEVVVLCDSSTGC
ncbi:MAG TPA: hypothetical protein VFP63_05915, partial [Dehalococcoidia bacterium]|nr:hypothetical protein [Dehalococcoidia bacterium]